jgi:acyl-CoA synthetase (AMP-forming)/AMP-acid ligase II
VTDGDWITAARQRYRQIESEPLPRNISALLRATAEAIPDAVALHFIKGDTPVTYAALHADVQRLANGLQRHGVGRGSRVAVMLPNVREMPVTWLALAAIGAVMVPVNIRYTGYELHYVLTDSEATHLVVDPAHHAVAAAMPSQPAALRSIIVTGAGLPEAQRWQDLLDQSAADFRPAIEPGLGDLLNIQYTSGTTGWPKGCLLTQRYWLTCAKAYAACDGLQYRRILSPNPFFYMTPQWLMLMAFYQGATLYVAPHLSLTQFVPWLHRYAIEFCYFPMDVLTQTAPVPDDAAVPLIRGNLAIHRQELHAALEARFGFPARSAFGMTEIGLGLIMPLAAADKVGSGSCGLAAPFREVRIATSAGDTVAAGETGELLIRGPGILLGYHGKPDATAAAFHGDWFRTGDLAMQDAAGFVTILGRIKEMIRRSGENISATEVEAALLAIPGIVEAAAIPVPDDKRGEEVKAYVVLEPGRNVADLPPDRIAALCAERLAPFKVPRLIEYRSVPLPRSTSGKVRKPELIAEKHDLRSGSWDRLTARWV